MNLYFMFKYNQILKVVFSVFFITYLSCIYGETPLTHSVTTEENGRVYQYFIIYQEFNVKAKPLVTYFWHRNGLLRSTTGDYSGNVLHGVSQEFDKSGRLLEKGLYYYGTKDGIWKSWNRNGKITRLEKWNRGFLRWRKSYEGSTYSLENFNNNRLNGRKITWNAGQKESVEHFKNGEICKRNKKSFKSYFVHKKQKKESDATGSK